MHTIATGTISAAVAEQSIDGRLRINNHVHTSAHIVHAISSCIGSDHRIISTCSLQAEIERCASASHWRTGICTTYLQLVSYACVGAAQFHMHSSAACTVGSSSCYSVSSWQWENSYCL